MLPTIAGITVGTTLHADVTTTGTATDTVTVDPPRTLRWTHLTVAITGGAGDIGLATARHLGGLGATIALIDLDDGKLEAARAQLAADGTPAHAWRCDVTDEAAVEATAAAIVERFGRVQHLFNNAGILGRFHPPLTGSASTPSRPPTWPRLHVDAPDGATGRRR